MAMTLKEAGRLTREDQSKIKALERRVDDIIRNNYAPGWGDLIIDPRFFGRFGTRVYDELKEIYETVGWSVKYESDQREGDFIRLSPRRVT